MEFNVGELAGSLATTLKDSLGQDWSKIEAFGANEAEKLAGSLVNLQKIVASGQVNEEQARALWRMYRNAALSVLLTVEGMGIIALERAINAALSVISETVNTALGFDLL